MAKSFNTNVATAWITTDINKTSLAPAEKTVTKTEAAEESKTEKKAVEKKSGAEKETSSAPAAKKTRDTEKAAFTISGKETKSRRTSILLKESIYTKLENLSKKNGISVNSCLNQILEQVLN